MYKYAVPQKRKTERPLGYVGITQIQVIREMNIKTVVKCHFLAIIKLFLKSCIVNILGLADYTITSVTITQLCHYSMKTTIDST